MAAVYDVSAMGCLTKILIGFASLVLLVGLAVYGALWAAREYLPGVAAKQFESATGFRATTRSLKGNLLSGELDVRGLKIDNPQGWPEDDFLQVDRAVLDVDRKTFSSNEPVVDNLTLDIGQINLVTTQDRQNNAALFYTRIPRRSADQTRPFKIKHLELAIDQIRVVDYSSGAPRITVIPIHARVDRTDVTEKNIAEVMNEFAKQAKLDELVRQNPALRQAIVQAALSSPQGKQLSSLGDDLQQAADAVKGQAESAGQTVNALIENLRGRLGK